MNDEKLRKARDTLYLRTVSRVIQALGPFIGLPVTPGLAKRIARKTSPLVKAGRSNAQMLAYRDYLKFVNNEDPVPKMDLNRFTDELWENSVTKEIGEAEFFSTEAAEGVGMSADFWSKDAEWGQRYDSAKRDKRIWKIARVDFEPPSCPWCTLQNSRGPVFHSADSYARTLHAGDTCTMVWVQQDDPDYPGKENTELAERRYKDAVSSVNEAGGRATAENVLKALRDQEPDRAEGVAKRNARRAARAAAQSKVTQTKALISKLERQNPKSESAKARVAELLERNRKLLSVLETS